MRCWDTLQCIYHHFGLFLLVRSCDIYGEILFSSFSLSCDIRKINFIWLFLCIQGKIFCFLYSSLCFFLAIWFSLWLKHVFLLSLQLCFGYFFLYISLTLQTIPLIFSFIHKYSNVTIYFFFKHPYYQSGNLTIAIGK